VAWEWPALGVDAAVGMLRRLTCTREHGLVNRWNGASNAL